MSRHPLAVSTKGNMFFFLCPHALRPSLWTLGMCAVCATGRTYPTQSGAFTRPFTIRCRLEDWPPAVCRAGVAPGTCCSCRCCCGPSTIINSRITRSAIPPIGVAPREWPRFRRRVCAGSLVRSRSLPFVSPSPRPTATPLLVRSNRPVAAVWHDRPYPRHGRHSLGVPNLQMVVRLVVPVSQSRKMVERAPGTRHNRPPPHRGRTVATPSSPAAAAAVAGREQHHRQQAPPDGEEDTSARRDRQELLGSSELRAPT